MSALRVQRNGPPGELYGPPGDVSELLDAPPGDDAESATPCTEREAAPAGAPW